MACRNPLQRTKQEKRNNNMPTKPPAPLALKKFIFEYALEGWNESLLWNEPLETEEQIDKAFFYMQDQIGCDAMQDKMCGEWETNMPAGFSRNCETKSVAVKDNYGNYIGFTRYYGGGKYFDESSWYDLSIQNAYYLTCEEKEVLTIQRTWAKVLD
jgi:hypothetical protein